MYKKYLFISNQRYFAKFIYTKSTPKSDNLFFDRAKKKLKLVTNCCKVLKVNLFPVREISSTDDQHREQFDTSGTDKLRLTIQIRPKLRYPKLYCCHACLL